MPAAQQKPALTKTKAGLLACTVGVTCAAILTPLVHGFEDGPKGPALLPYRDIVGVWTNCTGETENVTALSPAETPASCAVKLDTRLAGFAQAVQRRNPQVKGHDNQWAALTSLTYNIGVAGYQGSTVARRLDAGQWRAACDAILLWDKAGGKVVLGLYKRRAAERALCLKNLPA